MFAVVLALDAELDERFGNVRLRQLRADLEALHQMAQPPHRRTDPRPPPPDAE